MIVGVLPGTQAAVEIDDGPGAVVGQSVELRSMGSVGALDVGVELRRVGRETVEDVEALASALEEGPELAAAVDLEGADTKGTENAQGVQKLLGGQGAGAPMDLDDIPAANDVTACELPESDGLNGAQLQSIELHQVARGPRRWRPARTGWPS